MNGARNFLLMTTAAALCAAPMLAFGQANTGGSSQIQGTTQTTPQQGPLGGTPGARGAATTGADTGQAPNTGGAAGPAGQGRTTNPAGNATGEPLRTDGGRAAAPGAPGASAQGTPGPSQAQMDRMRQNEGNTTGNDARPGAASRTDGTPGNPPSTATQRAADAVTGNRTDADGTGNNPPGTAAGRAIDRATGGTAQNETTPRAGATGSGTTGAPATGSRAGTPAAGVTTGATTPGMAVDSARLQGARRASKLIGSNVYNENNESIGEVDDIIVPTGGGQPVAVLSVGGFLGIGARLIAVPYERLEWNAERDRWTLQGATRDSVRNLPEYRYEEERRRG